jgi:Cytochrome C oxidase, cbb3-type, subunit III
MTARIRLQRGTVCAACICGLLVAGSALLPGTSMSAKAGPLERLRAWHEAKADSECCGGGRCVDSPEGTWYWLRSPDEEKRVAAGLFNRYCIRCHGVDGRGVWDIPGVPDFTNPRWQASRTDAQRARIILEGRGAVMPPFRGALTLEEAYALGRYLHTFVPGTEVSKPDLTSRPPAGGQAQGDKKPETQPK